MSKLPRCHFRFLLSFLSLYLGRILLRRKLMNDCWLVDERERERVFFFFFWREEEFGLISDLIYYWKYRSFEDESKACRVSEWINLNRLLSNDQWKWSKECAIMTSKYVTREISYVLVIDHRCMHEIKTILFFSSFVAFFSFFFFSLDLLSTSWISRLRDLCTSV